MSYLGISDIKNYIVSCIMPCDETEVVVSDQMDYMKYKALKQDGFMFLQSNVSGLKCDYINVNGHCIIRKNFPREIEWLQLNGKNFTNSREPIYRRFLPPPLETIDHIFIISNFIAATNYKDKNYVEYGVRSGTSIEPISKLVNTAYGVDITNYKPINQNIKFYKMYTDEFSRTILKHIDYHYAFIDADHSSKQVLIDFEYIYKYIQKGGYIFLHDTYPCEEFLLQPQFCNDCYLSPLLIREKYPDIEMLTIPINPGLTIIRKPVV